MALNIFRKWYERYFFEEETVLLVVLLALSLLLLLTLGDILIPVLAAIVLAYLMQGLSNLVTKRGAPQWAGLAFAFLAFVGLFLGAVLLLLPLVWRESISFASALPSMYDAGKAWLSELGQKPPDLLGWEKKEQIDTWRDWVDAVQSELPSTEQFLDLGQSLGQSLLGVIPTLGLGLVYLILVPLLVFFFLKDRAMIFNWLGRFLPRERPLLNRIWVETDQQVANYARGKVIEILIVGGVSFFAFTLLGLNYAALLGLSVGLSVIIPIFGALAITVPVALIALFQWGVGSEFYLVVGVYLVIQILDGNVLVPLLFSEAVNLHPVAIILAVLFFGGLWGMWGIFFAIPLATLIKAVINAWPEPAS